MTSVSQGSSFVGVSETSLSAFSYGPSWARLVMAGRAAVNATPVFPASRRIDGRIVFRSTGKLKVTTISFADSGGVSEPDGERETMSSASVRNVNVVSPVSGPPSSERSPGSTLKVYSVAGASCPGARRRGGASRTSGRSLPRSARW